MSGRQERAGKTVDSALSFELLLFVQGGIWLLGHLFQAASSCDGTDKLAVAAVDKVVRNGACVMVFDCVESTILYLHLIYIGFFPLKSSTLIKRIGCFP